MQKLTTLITEQLQKFLELFDVLKDLSKNFKGFLGFSAFFLLCVIAVIFTMFSAGSFDRILDNLGTLTADQYYSLLLIGGIGSLLILLVLIVLGYNDLREQRRRSEAGSSGPPQDDDPPPPDGGYTDGFIKGGGLGGGGVVGEKIDPRTVLPPERIFISFAYEHHVQACRLADLLRAQHYHVWEIEQALPVTGLDLETELAIRRSDLVVVLVGNAVLDTLNVTAEAEFAFDLRKPLIHVLVEPPRGPLAKRFPEGRRLTMYSDWESESKLIVGYLRRVCRNGLRVSEKPLSEIRRDPPPVKPGGEEVPPHAVHLFRPQFMVAPAREAAPPTHAPRAQQARQKSNGRAVAQQDAVPFVTGVAVQPDQFVGRRAVLNEIHRRMSRELKSLSIVADRRMGKTSLLRYVASQSELLLAGHQDRVTVYISMQDARTWNPREIMRLLRREITQAAPRPLPLWAEREDGDIARLTETFDDLADEGIGLVLLLDELEMVMAHPELNDLLDQLRASGELSRIGMVVATAHELSDLVASGGLTSPFYNIFGALTMGLMPREEWITLVSQAYQRGGREVTAFEIDLLDRLAGGHPALVQMAGAVLWQARDQGWGPEEIRREYVHHASGILKSTWARLSQAERAVVQEVLGIRTSQRAAPATWDNLIRRGVLKHSEAVFCEPFIDIVREEVL